MEERDEAATDGDHSLHQQLLALYADKKRIEVEIEKREDELKLRIGTAASLAGIATWKSVEVSRLDQARLRLERPEVVEAFSATAVSRRFVVSRNVGE